MATTKTEHPENRFSAAYPPEVIRAAEDLIRSNTSVRTIILQIARIEALMTSSDGQLMMAAGEVTVDMSVDDAALVIGAIKDYARTRADRSQDDILNFDKP